MATMFGKYCRKLRIEHNEILRDMAEKLSVTAAYLSAVEIGKRNIPEKWEHIIAEKYFLSKDEKIKLHDAVENSVNQVKIDLRESSERQRQMAVMFARKLDELDEQELEKIFKIIKR